MQIFHACYTGIHTITSRLYHNNSQQIDKINMASYVYIMYKLPYNLLHTSKHVQTCLNVIKSTTEIQKCIISLVKSIYVYCMALHISNNRIGNKDNLVLK